MDKVSSKQQVVQNLLSRSFRHNKEVRMFARQLVALMVLLVGVVSCAPQSHQPEATRARTTFPTPMVSVGGSLLVELAKPRCPDKIPEPWANDQRASAARVVVVFKQDYLLGLYQHGQLASLDGQPACYQTALGATPTQPKVREDNSSTPEGWYWVGRKVPLGVSQFHRSLAVSYPSAEDAERAFSQGVVDANTQDRIKEAQRLHQMPPQGTPMGGDIMIHGEHGHWRSRTWTWGCVAIPNSDMDQLYEQVRVGDPVLILPWSVKIDLGEVAP